MSILRVSIFAVWLVHLSAIIGVYLGYADWFMSKTSWNLLLMGLLLVLNYPIRTPKSVAVASFIIAFSFFAEWIGVTTAFPFGEYSYGDNLGVKLDGVPLVIGFNWLYLSLGFATIAEFISENKWIRITLASLFMVALDLVIEPVAKQMDYWEFVLDPVPIANYVGWFALSYMVQAVIVFSDMKEKGIFSIHLIAATILYFGLIFLTY